MNKKFKKQKVTLLLNYQCKNIRLTTCSRLKQNDIRLLLAATISLKFWSTRHPLLEKKPLI